MINLTGLPLDSLEIEVGQFKIKTDDIIILDISPQGRLSHIGDHLDFLKGNNIDGKSIITMVSELRSRGIKTDDKIKELIQSGFFKGIYDDFRRISYSRVIIVKGKTTRCRVPAILIRDGFPSDFYLVPAEFTLHLAYVISHFITKEFLNIHNIDRLIMMSNPLEKFNVHDDDLIVAWDPSNNSVRTVLSDNSYTGDSNAGYLFFY